MAPSPFKEYCSVCGQPKDNSEHLIVNEKNHVSICTSCVEVGTAILKDHKKTGNSAKVIEFPRGA